MWLGPGMTKCLSMGTVCLWEMSISAGSNSGKKREGTCRTDQQGVLQ